MFSGREQALFKKKRLGDYLVEAGVITEQQLQQALMEQKQSRLKLGDQLIASGLITEQQLIDTLQFQLDIPYVQLSREPIDQQAVHLVPDKLAKKYNVLPLRIENNKLVVAMEDPLDFYAIDDLRMSTGFAVEPVITRRDELRRMINRYYSIQGTVEEIFQDLPKDAEETRMEQIGEDDAPIVRLVDQIIHEAVQMQASDIHFDPEEKGMRIRYRVDGILQTIREFPPYMHSVITARLKVLANLDIAESRKPQDGRIKMDVERRKIDIRVSVLPTIHGEKTVLRILDQGSAITEIEKLGFSPENERKFKKMIASPYGIVLVTGPTGSGKTTTLYSALNRLNREEVNIVTVEDPVEYQLDGINQVQVNKKTGLTFAGALSAILRQDPNIIMIGEIRDYDTAEIAIRAAMTGHLVLSTLHTNDAVSSINRLIDMGIEPFLVSSAVSCIVAQRLVRRICEECKLMRELSREEKEYLRQFDLHADTVAEGSGCPSCYHTGFKGRMAVHEVLTIDEKMREMIMRREPDSVYRSYLQSQGYATMLVDGLSKMVRGETTLSEVLRVIV
jgi:type IV pilus assembly protein PilB